MPKQRKIPHIDLEKSLMLRVEGEAGKYNSIPWDMLKKIGDSLQDLIKTIAKTDISNSEPIDLNNFNIELKDFYQGSAIPVFQLTPRVQAVVGDINKQRQTVSHSFSALMSIANSGNYLEIANRYATATVKGDISQKLYNFVSSFGNSPVEIVNKGTKGFKSVFKIQKFMPDAIGYLADKTDLIEIAPDISNETGVGRILIRKNKKRKSRKILELYRNKNAVLSYSPNVINFGKRQYVLNSPLLSRISTESNHFIIENEMLGIVAGGRTEDEAELDFAREFDHIYTRYNELNDDELSSRLLRIKVILNSIVKEVKSIS